MTHAGDDAAKLSNLQAKWGRHWLIRKRGDWIATRIDPAAGPYPTVMADTADDLNERLVRQADLARRGVNPVTISPAAPE